MVKLLLAVGLSYANPYPDENAVPKDRGGFVPKNLSAISSSILQNRANEVLRIDFAWNATNDTFSVQTMKRELSGTPALLRRALRPDSLGSYHATLFDKNGKSLSSASIGTGSEFRKLTRALNFRFPMTFEKVDLVLEAEDPVTGVRNAVLTQPIDPNTLPAPQTVLPTGIEIKVVKKATVLPALFVGIYGDGYTSAKKQKFFDLSQKVVTSLKDENFPFFDSLEFTAVFAPSNEVLGKAQDLGGVPTIRDSFLGLYYPFWEQFGRWYNVVYPTSETYFRDALSSVPYDYPIVLVDSAEYWGVGNFNELTAIPASHPSFSYLLIHEFGHFFGLNEEYEGGGRTELEFAHGISEPWSQNMTFNPASPKWTITAGTPVPTPDYLWKGKGPYGAYEGGYGDSPPEGKSHKPGHHCVMEDGGSYCPICRKAIEEKLKFDLGN